LQQHQALNVLKDLRLNEEQARKKARMEENLANMCLAVADSQPDALADISMSIDYMAPAYPSPLPDARCPSFFAATDTTAPRVAYPSRAAAASGDSSRANLHPNFNAASAPTLSHD
jgi:hypothetical protein